MALTLTNYENIAVTLCLMSIAILRRRLRDCARVRRRATRSWLLRRKQRSAYNTLLKELYTEDPNEFRNYFRMDKTTIQSILLWFHLSILISYSSCWFSLSRLFYYHVLLFCKHHLIIPKQYSDWLISIKVWRKIGWSSIPPKLVKVFDQRFLWPLSLSKFHQKLCQS